MAYYIANKPVRFDRDYAIGEIIPAENIDPKMEKRLIDWGKIIKINSEPPVTNNESESTPEGFICPVCGKICGSASGLTSHIKAKHDEQLTMNN